MKKKLVVLTGAGISAESGLKTFRDGDGLWENYRVEEVASLAAWQENPQRILRFYNERRTQVLSAQPNAAHLALSSLEQYFEVNIVTQNIDDLHERAGSTQVLHLHGEILKMCSEHDHSLVQTIHSDIQLGDLAPDGAQYRPQIVWFGEPVTQMEQAIALMETADIFVLVGSSLVVYPAAGLLEFVPAGIPKYIIDPVIPRIPNGKSYHFIEQSASIGVAQLLDLLVID